MFAYVPTKIFSETTSSISSISVSYGIVLLAENVKRVFSVLLSTGNKIGCIWLIFQLVMSFEIQTFQALSGLPST